MSDIDSKKKTKPTKEWKDFSSKEKRRVYIGIITVLGFILFWKEGGFLSALGITLFIYSIYYIYVAIRYNVARKKSVFIAVALMLVAMIVMPTTNNDTNTNSGNLSNSNTDQDNKNSSQLSEAKKITNGPWYEVTSITDGDTIKVKVNGKTETIRLIGIDTPETKDPEKPVQCFGPEASSRMQHFAQSKKVRLESDSSQGDRDKYKRLLRYVFTENQTNIAKAMILEGSAHEYTYNKPYKYQQEFKKAEADAKAAKKGFWADSTCAGNTEQTDPAVVKKQQEAEAARLQAEAQAAAAAAAQSRARQAPAPPAQPAPAPVASSVYYKNCTAVRAAGAAPIHAGSPGYGSHLDRDGDGVGCEN